MSWATRKNADAIAHQRQGALGRAAQGGMRQRQEAMQSADRQRAAQAKRVQCLIGIGPSANALERENAQLRASNARLAAALVEREAPAPGRVAALWQRIGRLLRRAGEAS